jgi:outer membrane protein insertion porin family
LSRPQQGLRLGVTYPFVYGRGVGVRGAFHFANTREFFGTSPQVSIACPPEFLETEDGCPEEITARNAVVFYRRGGLEWGAFSDVGPNSRVYLEWRGDLVHVRARPAAASERRGALVRPVDFAIEHGYSVVSLLSASFLYETRDDPAMPRRGTAVRVQTDVGSRAMGSDYEFLRVQARYNRWLPIGETQYLRLGVFAGLTFGAPPFFLKFHIADLTDLIPSRILGMNLDRRSPPNLLGTSIELMRNEEFAARFDIEYGARLFSGEGNLRNLSIYALVGLFSLADAHEMRFALRGYEGLSRVPIDLTFDVGLRFDTPIGVFQLAFSNLLGFIQL